MRFKVGDGVVVIDEDYPQAIEKYVGMTGVVTHINDVHVVFVKMDKPLTTDPDNDLTENTRQFYEQHLDYSKNHIVTNILNDL